MKYEKYLKQIAETACSHLYWAAEFARQAKEPNPNENVIKQLQQIEHCMWKVSYYGRNHEWMEQALAVPKQFVEKSKRTTAVAVLNEWCNENKGQEE